VTQRIVSRPANRPHRSEFDHRAIDMTGHLLLAIVSIERRFASVPEQFSCLVDMAGRSGPIGRLRVPLVAEATGNQS
jgi:hypothetical protein